MVDPEVDYLLARCIIEFPNSARMAVIVPIDPTLLESEDALTHLFGLVGLAVYKGYWETEEPERLKLYEQSPEEYKAEVAASRAELWAKMK